MAEARKRTLVVASLLLACAAGAMATMKQDETVEAGKRAYERSDYTKAVEVLQVAAAREPKNAEIQWWLAKTYFEIPDHDAAIASAEKAVALDPKNSRYHEWLGKAYGDKADHAGMFSALSLAKKTHKELETAVQLDERNFSARQALIEFDCSAPGIVGGGEDRARAEIEKLSAMDAAEGHFAKGNCRWQKKDFATTDAEFTLALEAHPKSANLLYDIGDYAMKRGQADRLLEVADEGEKVAPEDPRGKFYRALGLILKNERPEQAERLLREYSEKAPLRTGYPRPTRVHEWMGRLFENEGQKEAALKEYHAAVQFDAKNKGAREAIRRLEKN